MKEIHSEKELNWLLGISVAMWLNEALIAEGSKLWTVWSCVNSLEKNNSSFSWRDFPLLSPIFSLWGFQDGVCGDMVVSLQCKPDAIVFGAFKCSGHPSSRAELPLPLRFTVLCISLRKLRFFCIFKGETLHLFPPSLENWLRLTELNAVLSSGTSWLTRLPLCSSSCWLYSAVTHILLFK